MSRIAKRLCVDCGNRLKNRRKKTKRCQSCHLKKRQKSAHGRIIGIRCKKCNKELSCKKSITGLCKSCYLKNRIPHNKGKKGCQIAWNKGKGLYKTKEEYRNHFNLIRKKSRLLNVNQTMADRIRTLIRNQIKHYSGKSKNCKTTILLGCELKFFISYLESKFMNGMSWSNYGNGHGKWNIDHIFPVSKFDLSLISEQKKAFNFTNCRPMWAIENIKKGNKLNHNGNFIKTQLFS